MAAISFAFAPLSRDEGAISPPPAVFDQSMAAFEEALQNLLASPQANPQPAALAPTLGLPSVPRSSIDLPLIGIPSGGPATVLEATEGGAAIPLPDGLEATCQEEPARLEQENEAALLAALQALPLPLSPVLTEPSKSASCVTELAGAATERASEPAAPPARARQTQPYMPGGLNLSGASSEPRSFVREGLVGRVVAEHASTAAVATKTQSTGEKSSDVRAATLAQPAARQQPEAGVFSVPRFIEGGRVEWSAQAPTTPQIDPARSMSDAISAATSQQRTVHHGAESVTRRDRERAPVSARKHVDEPRAEQQAGADAATPLVEPPPALPLDDKPMIESAVDASSFAMPLVHTKLDPAVAPAPAPVTVAELSRFAADAGRERRQDDAELSVSRMTLAHRVEARTVVAELGAITVKAESKDGQVELTVLAERPETGVFLDQNRVDLTRDLRLSSPAVADLSVSTGPSGDGQRHPQEQRAARETWRTGTPTSMASTSVSEPTQRATTANGRRVRVVL